MTDSTKDMSLGDLRALATAQNVKIAALEAEKAGRQQAVPSGFVTVPVEPTREMVIAGEDAWDAQLDARLDAKMDGSKFAEYPSEETHELCSRVAYRAMLAAAPQLCTQCGQPTRAGKWLCEAHCYEMPAATAPAERVEQEAAIIADAEKWCADNESTPREFLAHGLLVKRSALLGRPLKWAETLDVLVTMGCMSKEEQAELLALDDPAPAASDVAGLIEALESCASELNSMINNHNQMNSDDGSWLYDQQTVSEAYEALAAYRKDGK